MVVGLSKTEDVMHERGGLVMSNQVVKLQARHAGRLFHEVEERPIMFKSEVFSDDELFSTSIEHTQHSLMRGYVKKRLQV